MTAAEQGRGKNLRNATKESARSAELHRVERKNVHLALLTVRASAPKEMLAIIGILLSAGSSSRGTAQLVRNAASYIHLEKEVQQLPHQSRKATKKKTQKGRQRAPRRPHDRPKMAQDDTRCPQDRPKWPNTTNKRQKNVKPTAINNIGPAENEKRLNKLLMGAA